jgi:hypothetical protein
MHVPGGSYLTHDQKSVKHVEWLVYNKLKNYNDAWSTVIAAQIYGTNGAHEDCLSNPLLCRLPTNTKHC